jgi:hypothetical protein
MIIDFLYDSWTQILVIDVCVSSCWITHETNRKKSWMRLLNAVWIMSERKCPKSGTGVASPLEHLKQSVKFWRCKSTLQHAPSVFRAWGHILLQQKLYILRL